MVTAADLNDLAYLPGEIDYLTREIERLKRPPYLKDMDARHKAECAAALTELIEILQDRRQKSARQLDRLRAFLDSIQDDFTRELFRLRYEDGREWLHVWNIVTDRGYYYEPDSLRVICRRYLERYNRNEAGKD